MQLSCRWGTGQDTVPRGQAATSPRLASDRLVTAEEGPDTQASSR